MRTPPPYTPRQYFNSAAPAPAPQIQSSSASFATSAPPLAAAPANAGRAGVLRMLTLDRPHRARNLEQALQRLDALFLPQIPSARSHAAIDDYLSNNTFSAPVPPEVRQAMVALDADINAVHRAIPFGRGNVLVRHTATTNTRPTIDFETTYEKTSLKALGERTNDAMRSRRDTPMDASVKITALGILTGAAACEAYVNALALVAARRCNRAGLGDRARLQIYHNPKLDPHANAPRIDHSYATMEFTDRAGRMHRIVLDPWADTNRVILQQHSPYSRPRTEDNGAHLTRVDASVPARIEAQMIRASDRYLRQAGAALAELPISGIKDLLLERDNPTRRYDVRNPLVSGYVDTPVDMARPGVYGPVRRPSLIAAEHSPLLSGDELLDLS